MLLASYTVWNTIKLMRNLDYLYISHFNYKVQFGINEGNLEKFNGRRRKFLAEGFSRDHVDCWLTCFLRYDEDRELLKVACHKLKTVAMQHFANYGWRFTNRLK